MTYLIPTKYSSPQEAYDLCADVVQPPWSPVASSHWQQHCALQIVKREIDNDEVGFASELLNIITKNY
jgi:hypothetical protein